jgi:hypothetical protein
VLTNEYLALGVAAVALGFLFALHHAARAGGREP